MNYYEVGKEIAKGFLDVIAEANKCDCDTPAMNEPAPDAEKEVPKKRGRKPAKKDDVAEKKSGNKYESMSVKDLYTECCERGISTQCKKRDKATLIDVLMKDDAGDFDDIKTKKPEPAKRGRKPKKAEPEPVDDSDDWNDDDDNDAETDADADAYEGKSAKELYAMCKERGLKATPKKNAEYYAGILKKDDDAKKADVDDDSDDWEDDSDDDSDDWEF